MHKKLKKLAIGTAAVAGLLLGTHFAWADETITVELWDSGAETEMPTDMGLAMAHGNDMSNATMGIRVSTDTVAAGQITFDVTNVSTDTIHEMVLAHIDDVTKPLPFNAEENEVDEEAVEGPGEVSELDTGESGSLTVNLDAGTYILYCNLPGHYAAGMWTLLTVK